MREMLKYGLVEIGLSGTIQFQQARERIECVVQDMTDDYGEFVVIASDPRVCARENIDLSIFLPTERTPIKCSGKIIRYSKNSKSFRGHKDYIARVSINYITRIDRRRLELVVAQKRAYTSGGYGLSYSF